MNEQEFVQFLVRSVIYWHRHKARPTLELCAKALIEQAEREYPLELLGFEVSEESLLIAVYKTKHGFVARTVDAMQVLLAKQELSLEPPRSLPVTTIHDSILMYIQNRRQDAGVIPLPKENLGTRLPARHTISGRMSSYSPNCPQIPIQQWSRSDAQQMKERYLRSFHEYGHYDNIFASGALRRGTEAHRRFALGPLEPALGDSGHPGRGGECFGSVEALHQPDGGGGGEPGVDHRWPRAHRDDAGCGVRVVGAEQGPVRPVRRDFHARCRRGHGHGRRGK